MVANLQCLGKEVDPNILLLLGFFQFHKVSHSKFECSSCQEAIEKVLTHMMGRKDNKILGDELIERKSSIKSSKFVEKIEEEIEDLNMS